MVSAIADAIVVEGLGAPGAARVLQPVGDGILATQTFKYDADLVLRAVTLARLTADLTDMLFGR